MDGLLIVRRDDPRIGTRWVTTPELAARHGQSVSAVQLRLGKKGFRPVARVGRSGAYLYDVQALESAGELASRAIDPVTEAWAGDFARETGLANRSSALLLMLRLRLGTRLGRAEPASSEELIQAGVARRAGDRWAVVRAAAAELLARPYDPEHEATVEELTAEFPYANQGNLARALRGHVESRQVLDVDGRHRLVFDRAAAREFFAGRGGSTRHVRPVTVTPEVARGDEALRSHVGPVELRAPTRRNHVSVDDAAWLLQRTPREVRRALAVTPEGRASAQGHGVAVSWLEAELAERGDFEGLVLFARILDGVLAVSADIDRAEALLRADG